MVSLHSQALFTPNKPLSAIDSTGLGILLAEHPQWKNKSGWKNLLNNLCLVLQPFAVSNLVKSWLQIFLLPQIDAGLNINCFYE